MFDTKYTKVQERIKFDINNGRFGGRHTKLPPFRTLAEEYNVSPVTISKAMNYLRNEKIIDIRGTRGAFVKKNIKGRERVNNIAIVNNFVEDHAGLCANEILEDYATNHNMGLLTLSAIGNIQYEPSLYTSLESDGFIFMHSSLTSKSATALHNAKIPFVSLNHLDHDFVSWVDYDNEGGVAEVLDYLLECGCRKIAYVDLKVEFGNIQQRIYNIYKQKMIDAGCFDNNLFIAHDPIKDIRRQFKSFFIEKAGKRMADCLLQLPEFPDAVLIQRGASYNALLEECRLHGVDLPRKTKVVLNIEDSQKYPDDISISLKPFREKVKQGFDLLYDFISTRRLNNRQIILKQKLIKRD